MEGANKSRLVLLVIIFSTVAKFLALLGLGQDESKVLLGIFTAVDLVTALSLVRFPHLVVNKDYNLVMLFLILSIFEQVTAAFIVHGNYAVTALFVGIFTFMFARKFKSTLE